MTSGSTLRYSYFLLFAPLGIYIPYLPLHFKEAGYTTGQIAVLFAILPALKAVASPVWGHAADVTGATGRLLRVAACLAVIGSLAWLPQSVSFPAACAGMTLYALARAPMPAMVDTSALEFARRGGGDYSRLRLWGSLGFVAASMGAGVLIDRAGITVTPALVVAANIAFALATFAARDSAASPEPPSSGGEGRLLTGGFVVLTLAATIHNVATSPYNTFFGIYVSDLGLPTTVTGAGWAVAVISEILMMLVASRAVDRFGAPAVMTLSLAASALRWMLVAAASGALAMIAIQALHAFTFGTFLVAAVTYIGNEVPTGRRTTGQTLFGAMCFGVGPLVGTLAAGWAYEQLGNREMFVAAGVLEAAAAVFFVVAMRRFSKTINHLGLREP